MFVSVALKRVWSADFMSNDLDHGREFHTLNVLDHFIVEVLAIEIAASLQAESMIRVLDRLKAERQ